MKPQLTIEAFADWCEKQPTDGKFNIYSTGHCAVAQFAKSLGFERGSNLDFTIDAGGGCALKIDGLTDRMMCRGEDTFGALASRLRAQA